MLPLQSSRRYLHKGGRKEKMPYITRTMCEYTHISHKAAHATQQPCLYTGTQLPVLLSQYLFLKMSASTFDS